MAKRNNNSVTLVEMGLRDGLQNEAVSLSVEQKTDLAIRLIEAGSRRLELGAFVREDKVPQMMGSEEVIEKVLEKYPTVQASALVPNEKGMWRALETKIKEVAVFGAASETFSKKNINCTIEESLQRFAEVIKLAKKNKIKVRGYLSTCFGCPYEGKVDPKKVIALAAKMYKMGCYEISIGDTIGVATPGQVENLFKELKKKVPVKALAGHFHDTRGTALANIHAAYSLGVRVFDTSVGGLGGCPYAPGASGNVATEDVVYMFHGDGIKTGLELDTLKLLNQEIAKLVGHQLPSKVGGL
jgi:hydroxymethylglutaryl-CoA lyase